MWFVYPKNLLIWTYTLGIKVAVLIRFHCTTKYDANKNETPDNCFDSLLKDTFWNSQQNIVQCYYETMTQILGLFVYFVIWIISDCILASWQIRVESQTLYNYYLVNIVLAILEKSHQCWLYVKILFMYVMCMCQYSFILCSLTCRCSLWCFCLHDKVKWSMPCLCKLYQLIMTWLARCQQHKTWDWGTLYNVHVLLKHGLVILVVKCYFFWWENVCMFILPDILFLSSAFGLLTVIHKSSHAK